MDIILLLFAFAGFIGVIALFSLFWAIKNKQYEDLEGDAARILFDDDKNIK